MVCSSIMLFCSGHNLQFSMRFATLFLRYEFLCKLMYLLPSYGTMSKRISSVKLHVGVRM